MILERDTFQYRQRRAGSRDETRAIGRWEQVRSGKGISSSAYLGLSGEVHPQICTISFHDRTARGKARRSTEHGAIECVQAEEHAQNMEP